MGAKAFKSKISAGPQLRELIRPRLTRKQRKLVRKYLPHFQIFTKSLRADIQVAGAFWNGVFRSTRSNPSSYSTHSLGRNSACGSISTNSPISQLYDEFYKILDNEVPQLVPIFRSSLQVRSKVLGHITVGIQAVLKDDGSHDKIIQLTRTHLRVGIKLEHYDPLGCVLLKAMEIASGKAWTSNVEEAWRRIFTHSAVILMSYHEKLTKESKLQRWVSRLSSGRSDLVIPFSAAIPQDAKIDTIRE